MQLYNYNLYERTVIISKKKSRQVRRHNAYNSITREVMAGGLEISHQPRLYSGFHASTGYIERPYLRKK
jgi:hypothetical protein